MDGQHMAKDFNINPEYIDALARALQTPEFLGDGDCVGENPNLWDDEDASLTAQGTAICAQCPVRELCAAWGNKNEEFGIWGGIGGAERRRLRRGTKFVSMEDRRDDLDWRTDVAGRMSAADVARKWGKAEKTVYRWRETQAS